MANIGDFTVNISLVPDKITMAAILKLLDLWQEHNKDKMVAMVPDQDRYVYEIIERK